MAVWQLVGEGRIADGLGFLDDTGTWWDMATRDDGPRTRMKVFLAEAVALVPMEFTLVGSLVGEHRVALMVESFADLPGGGRYNSVYMFLTTLHPDKDVIVGIREYVDTAHAYQTLAPALLAARDGTGGSAMGALLGESQ
jgi:ketosteroid isomerase-like protein